MHATLNGDEENPNTLQNDSQHNFIFFAINVPLQEVNQNLYSYNNLPSNEEEDFPNLRTAYEALLEEWISFIVITQNLRPNAIFFENELNVLKVDQTNFNESKAKKIKLLKKIRQLKDDKLKFIGLIDSLKAANLENEKIVKNFKNTFAI